MWCQQKQIVTDEQTDVVKVAALNDFDHVTFKKTCTLLYCVFP